MDKYLFTDGTNEVREVQSKEELHTLIQASGDPARARIWIFSTSEWITYAEFSKRLAVNTFPIKTAKPTEEKKRQPVKVKSKAVRTYEGPAKFLFAVITCVTIFLVYNFSRVKWYTAGALQIAAARPGNTPLVDMDSLIPAIEIARGQKLDKVTQTNLRIRNNWPDRVELKLKSDRDTSQTGTKFYNVEISIDNSTGYNIDNAVVELRVWQNEVVTSVDTFHFNNIGYSALSDRMLTNEYRGDNLSVSFLSIRARAFNFCYSYDKESNYGNLNDRWFCRE